MSLQESLVIAEISPNQNKKKRSAEQAELEVDLEAPEPPSKKALRKAKKVKDEKKQDALPALKEGVEPSKKIGENVNNVGKRSDHGIWIGNLAFATTREDLFKFMTSDTEHVIQEDKITRVNLPSSRAKNGKVQNKGFAYVDLADSKSHSSALELSEKLLGGRRVLIKDSKSFEGRPAEGTKERSNHPPSKRIFLGNLTFDVTVEDIERHFGVCGTISSTHMATFEDSGKCKGYAWLEFEELSSAQAAMRGWIEEGTRRIWLHNLNGRKLRLEYAEDKATRYQKRYGKNAEKANDDVADIVEVPDKQVSDRQNRGGSGKPSAVEHEQHQSEKRNKVRKNGYAEDTVKRLTGAIVEGKGQKVTFE